MANFLFSLMSKPPPAVVAKALLEKVAPAVVLTQLVALLLQVTETRAPPKLTSKNGWNLPLFR